jgi:hypothetical protein
MEIYHDAHSKFSPRPEFGGSSGLYICEFLMYCSILSVHSKQDIAMSSEMIKIYKKIKDSDLHKDLENFFQIKLSDTVTDAQYIKRLEFTKKLLKKYFEYEPSFGFPTQLDLIFRQNYNEVKKTVDTSVTGDSIKKELKLNNVEFHYFATKLDLKKPLCFYNLKNNSVIQIVYNQSG